MRACFKALIHFIALLLLSFVQAIGQQPNIIFILTDDLGYGDIGVFFQNQRRYADRAPEPYQITPHIDAMASAGARFLRQYANAPVCAPSRASLLTGKHQGNAHVRDNQFDKAIEDNHNMATVLKQAGYATAIVGKWGLQGEKEEAPYWPAHPLKRGFDRFFGYMRHRDGHEHYPVEGVYRGSKEVWQDYVNVAENLAKCYTTDLWTAYAKEWIIDQKRGHPDQPFFLYLAYDAPHAALELPTSPYPAGGGLYGGLKWTGEKGRAINTASGDVDSYVYPEYAHALYDHDQDSATPPVPWPLTFQRYASSVRRIDDAVGDILKLLQDLKIDSNTLVVFTSDNGPSIESYLPENFVPNLPTFFASYGPFDGIKRDCWEGGLRMPTVATWPGKINAGTIISHASMFSDWLPTLAEMAGMPAPARSDGVSLVPVLAGVGKQARSQIYVEYFEQGRTPDFSEFEPAHRNRLRNQMQMAGNGDFVGVRYNIRDANDDFEIYDVVHDPQQRNNLALSGRFDVLQQELKKHVLRLRRTDSASPRPYDSSLIPATDAGKTINKGLKWYHFEGEFPWVAALKPENADDSGYASSLNATHAASDKKSGMFLIKGFVYIPADGSYQFSLQTTGKAFVKLHDADLFDADYGYAAGRYLHHTIRLQKGLHPVRIYFLKNQQSDIIHLSWRTDKRQGSVRAKGRFFYSK